MAKSKNDDPTIKSTASAAGDPPVEAAPPVNEAAHATVNQSHSPHPDIGSALSEDQVVQVEDGTDPPKDWFRARPETDGTP